MTTPSPSPLTPTPPATQSSVGSFDKVPSPKQEAESANLASFTYLTMYPPGQQSPVKLTPLTDDLSLDFCPAADDRSRQMIRTREFHYYFCSYQKMKNYFI